ncbi:MAG: LamG domain-containing protein, partial [FCB group bacterium]|nr:LamG domain-containing protein [FCB group bacterium]
MFKRIQICGITALLLLPAWLSAQQTCEPNYSSPYTVINNVMVTGSMSNNHYSTFMTVGQAFIDTSPNYSATNYSVNSNATGLWSTYLKEPRPPLVWASDGDFQDMVLVEWQVEDDRTGPPVSGEMVTLYRNGYVLTQLPVAQTQYQDFNVFAGEYYDYGVTSSNDMGTSYTQDDIGFLNPNGVITGHVETRGGNPMLDTKVLLTPNLGRSAMFDGQSYIYFFDQNTSANKQFSGLMGDYTIETWFRSIVSEQQTIFAAVDSATANHYVLLELTDQGQVHWMHNPVAGLVDAELTTVNGFTDDSAWHHIAAVFEDNHMTLYVDAAIVGETTASGPVLDSAEIMIGKLDPTNTLDYYDGRLDDFRIWNLARSWADLRKYIDITLSGEEWGLAAYWKFDEVEGETIFDLTENDIDGTICGVDHNNFTAPVFVGALSDSTGNYVIRGIYFGGGTTFTATPSKTTPIGRSLEFDGIDDHVSFTGQRIDLTGEYTLEGWFKTPSQFQQTLFAGVDPDGGATHLAVEMNPAGFIEVDYGTGIIVSNAAYNDNLWHHFAVSSDGAELILYVDAADISGPVMPGDIDVLTELVLARQAPEVSGNYFGGYLDEFRLWDYMRSDVQIAGGMYLPQEDDSYGLASYWRMNEGSCDLIADATGNLVTGTIQEALWSMDIPLSEVFHHIYEPESRQATLNHSNTSVDMVDFTDISLIAISGFVRYVDTACFQGGVEMLLNGEPFLLPNFTDEDGKYIVEIEPGSTGDILSCRYADHAFIPPFIELPMISVPITALYFNDTMVHDAGGIVAGGECQYPITPALGSIAVTMTAVNGCIERTVVPSESTGMWEMTDMPPLIYQVTVDHPDPAIDSFFTGDTLQITEGDGEENFIYTAPPEISLTGFPTDDCGLRVMKQYNQDDPQSGPYELTANMFETYINHIGPDTNTCPIDTGMVQIISNLGDATRDTTVAFSGGELTFLMGAGQPNILSGGDHPYQKSIQAVMSDSTGAPLGSTTEWTYVVGRRPRETGFATTTPEIPFMIIHQPPGDGSSAYWSAGTSFSQSMQFSLATSAALNTWVVAHLGPDFESTQGSPFFSVGTEIDTQLDIGLDIGVEVSSEIADEQVWTWSTTETVTTAGEGDVYMGGALNLLYGMTDVVYIDESCTASDSATILITPEGFATNYFYSESHILDQVIPNLYLIGEDESAELWQDYVDLNHANMEAAAYEKNISFDAGVEYAYEDVYESENSLTYSMGLDIVTEIAIEAGVEINGLGVTSGMRVTLGVSIGAGGSSTWVNTTTTGYTLADEDSGDSFTIDVKSDPVYATPVFETISGFSSCPWEENTVPRDGPSLGVAPMMQINVPPDEFAVFDLLIGNVSQTDEDREYAISVVQSSNPDGAVVAVNGVIIEDALYFDVPAGATIMSTMTIGRAPAENNYNGLESRLFSPFDPHL